jgi:hypothetical protein
MLKRSLFAVAAVALLAMVAQAGEIKMHEWPTSFVPQVLTTIPVVMDVGFWAQIKDQDKLKITLNQTGIHDYSGCTDVTILCNFNLTVSCSIAANGAVPGTYGCSVAPNTVDNPGAPVSVCATLSKADLTKTAGGTKGIQVATVTLKIVPR